MAREEMLARLVPRLMAASYFDDAATAVLEGIFDCTEKALSAGGHLADGRLLRGVVHLRQEGSYQRLFGIERSTGVRVDGTGYLTSGNVWNWIEEHRCSVSIDLRRAAMRTWLPDGAIERIEPVEPAGLPGDATRERMLGRESTHVHVVPLRAPGGRVEGMVTLEANFSRGGAEVWELCYEELEIIASVAGAFIAVRAPPLRVAEPAGADEFLPVIGQSTAQLVELLRTFAPRDDTVLITGPTGAGKSRLARWCHEHSSRKAQPFEQLNVLSVPEELQMAELFGWRRGAFTGAVDDNPGAVTRAAKGTLFIDEVDKLSLKTQSGLLRFIDERSFRMLGDKAAKERISEVRLIVGTNADLRAAVRAGRFREDLYYRINVLPVRLLPLAERLDELAQWARFMLERRHRDAGGQGTVRLESEAVRALLSEPWPGNLRQLDNIIRRAYALLLGEQPRPGHDLLVQRHHIERALTFDEEVKSNALMALLWRAARAFVDEAERRQRAGASLSLELTEAFRGMVLGAAVQRRSNRDEAFLLLDQEGLVKNRNHHRALRRELARVRELLRAVEGAGDRELLAMLDTVETSTEDA